MPIPGFKKGLLPPYDGEAARIDNSSPYPATTLELCEQFATTPERKAILKGFLNFRALLHQLQIVDGFQ